TEERPHPHHHCRHIGWREDKDRVLHGLVRQRGVVMGITRDLFGSRLRYGDAHLPRLIENDGVTVHNLERLNRITALVADDGVLADAFKMGFRPNLIAGRAPRGNVWVAEAIA